MRMWIFVVAAAFSILTSTAEGQWLKLPTVGLPRLPGGAPDIAAPAPRTADGRPDFTGLWTSPERRVTASPSELHPWVNEAARGHAENFFKARPMFRCLPSGPATFGQSTGGGVWKRIVQTPRVIVILNDDLTYRQIFMDGRALEANPIPSWMGYSVGRWEGETLVVESFGFNDKTWLNGRGLQHTEALRMIERYNRRDVGHLKIDVTFTDPGAFYRPLPLAVDMALAPDTEMLERVCEAGSDDWPGTVSDMQRAAVAVSPDILKRYVGVYAGLWGGNVRKVDVRLVDGRLVIRINDSPEALPLTPLSEKLFASAEGFAYEFVAGEDAPAKAVVEIHVTGGYEFVRQE